MSSATTGTANLNVTTRSSKALGTVNLIAHEAFQVFLVAYLILLIAETLKPGFVSLFFNVNYLLGVILVAGVVMVLTGRDKVDEVKQQRAITNRDFLFTLCLATAGAVLVYIKTVDIGWISIVLMELTFIIISLVSYLVFTDRGDEAVEIATQPVVVPKITPKAEPKYVIEPVRTPNIKPMPIPPLQAPQPAAFVPAYLSTEQQDSEIRKIANLFDDAIKETKKQGQRIEKVIHRKYIRHRRPMRIYLLQPSIA